MIVKKEYPGDIEAELSSKINPKIRADHIDLAVRRVDELEQYHLNNSRD